MPGSSRGRRGVDRPRSQPPSARTRSGSPAESPTAAPNRRRRVSHELHSCRTSAPVQMVCRADGLPSGSLDAILSCRLWLPGLSRGALGSWLRPAFLGLQYAAQRTPEPIHGPWSAQRTPDPSEQLHMHHAVSSAPASWQPRTNVCMRPCPHWVTMRDRGRDDPGESSHLSTLPQRSVAVKDGLRTACSELTLHTWPACGWVIAKGIWSAAAERSGDGAFVRGNTYRLLRSPARKPKRCRRYALPPHSKGAFRLRVGRSGPRSGSVGVSDSRLGWRSRPKHTSGAHCLHGPFAGGSYGDTR